MKGVAGHSTETSISINSQPFPATQTPRKTYVEIFVKTLVFLIYCSHNQSVVI